jgi:hypothetical protein
MSETPNEPQTGIKKDGREQVGSVEANSPALGSRSLQAGGEFLKALAGDLAAVVSRLRLSLIAKHRRTEPPRASAPPRVSQDPQSGVSSGASASSSWRSERSARGRSPLSRCGCSSGSLPNRGGAMRILSGRNSKPERASRWGASARSTSQELRGRTLSANTGRRASL